MANARADLAGLSRRERCKREVHDRILEAAVERFEQNGFEGTKVDEICEAADVAQKTFFNHFPTKQHLFRELAEAVVDEMHAVLEDARRQPLPTAGRLRYFFERVEQNTEAFGRVSRELIVEAVRVSQLEGGGPKETRRMHASFGALLREGVESGDVGDAFSVEFLTEMTAGVFSAIFLNWVTLPEYPIRERLHEAADFLAATIALRRGAS
jgi:AcrR family transcriptional regulator